MTTNEEVARKLALITGKPITEFFKDERANNISTPLDEVNLHVGEVENNKEENTDSTSVPIRIIEGRTKVSTWSEQIIEYQKMFKESEIVGGNIMNGRQMTRKEYLKFTKGLTYQALLAHPLLYKMFRAEGQLDPSFMSWPNKFPKVEEDEE